MIARDRFERTAATLSSLDKTELKRRIQNFKGRFRLDFTEEYLNNLPADRLRHILLAALISASH